MIIKKGIEGFDLANLPEAEQALVLMVILKSGS